MQTRQLGNSDLQITAMGVGAWAMGGGGWKFGWGHQDDELSAASIRAAVDAGINWVDTAAIYGLGHSEEVVGEALAGISNKPYVFTKCARNWNDEGEILKILKADKLREECENSLRRLKIDVIDLYQIHWPEPDEDVEEGWETLAKLKEEGKVRHIGVSNFSISQLERAMKIAPITSVQPPYSIVQPEIEADLLPFCAQHNIGVIVYAPMKSGLLTGKMTRERLQNMPEDDWRLRSGFFTEPMLTRNLALVDMMREIGTRYGRTPAEVAIAWTLRRPEVTGAIVGLRNPGQLDGVIGAAELRLTEEEINDLDAFMKANPAEKPVSRKGPLMQQINRRDLFRGGLATALTTASAAAIDYTKPVPEAEGLTAYKNGDEIILRWNNHVLTTYRAHESMKYPYFYPIAGPVTGASLTTESALPYPHHRGLWLGCEPLNGGNYWADNALSTGHIRSTGISIGENSKTSAVMEDRCDWVREGAPSPWRDERKFTVKILNEKSWVIDCDFRIIALEDVSIKRAKHSLFAIRTASDICPPYGGTLMNSEGGINAKGTYGKVAKWCSFFGKRRGTGSVEGIAVMDHPENPWSPCPWFTRDYGHLSPSPLNFIEKPFTMAKGESIRLRYRVAAHAGDPAAANLDGVYNEWISG